MTVGITRSGVLEKPCGVRDGTHELVTDKRESETGVLSREFRDPHPVARYGDTVSRSLSATTCPHSR